MCHVEQRRPIRPLPGRRWNPRCRGLLSSHRSLPGWFRCVNTAILSTKIYFLHVFGTKLSFFQLSDSSKNFAAHWIRWLCGSRVANDQLQKSLTMFPAENIKLVWVRMLWPMLETVRISTRCVWPVRTRIFLASADPTKPTAQVSLSRAATLVFSVYSGTAFVDQNFH